MNRNNFKEIAIIRIKEAHTLLKSNNFDGAYYLAGYAVECALKACIAKNTKRFDFPDIKTVTSSYSHNLEQLLKVAGLWGDLLNQTKGNIQFASNWNTVKDWNESSRYQRNNSKEAHDLYSAITDKKDGVFNWIKQYW
jgi:HEPN domain-containing protein